VKYQKSFLSIGVGTNSIGFPQSTVKTNETLMHKHSKAKKTADDAPRLRSDSHEAGSIGRLDRTPTPTRTRHRRRDASTASRLVRGPFDKASRLSANSDSHDPWVESLDLSYSPTLRQKSEHLIRLPTTFYHHGYSRDRRGSNAGARSHFLLPIPGWEVKICHYAHLTAHCFATNHPRGRIRQGPYPTVSGIRPYPTSLDPALTHHRSTRKKSLCGIGLRVFSPSRPRRHHGVRGWPAIPEARRYSHLHMDR
jgi:hypothetical protein